MIKKNVITDFIGIFPNALSKEYCEKVIKRYEYIQETQSEWGHAGRGKIWSRQEAEKASYVNKENDTYFLSGSYGDDLPLEEKDEILMNIDMPLMKEFISRVADVHALFKDKYGLLNDVVAHQTMSPAVRIQKYKPSQGYHIWHCDDGRVVDSRRMMTVAAYLNTVEEGGETEFIYQNMRVSPVQGTIALHPSGWTHMHRGNPPLKGNKYFMTTWLEYVE